MRVKRIVRAAILITLFLQGCVKQQSNTIKIGATLPLTGDVASYGVSAERGIQVFVKQVNDTGGIDGRKLEVQFQDDKGSATEAVNIMNDFVSVQKVPAVIGSAGSSVTLGITPIANAHRVVLISPISSSVELTEKGGGYFFRVCPSDDQQANILANWVSQDGIKRVAVVYTNNDWGLSLAENFKRLFEAKGGKVILLEATKQGQQDFRSILAKVKSARPQALVSSTYPKEGGALVKQARQLGLKIPLYGGDNWGAPEFLQIAGDAADGVKFTAPSIYAGEQYEEFAKLYKNEFGTNPSVFSAYGYDAIKALALAAAKCQGGVSGEKLRQALHQVRFQGVSNYIAFDNHGDLKTEAFSRDVIQRGTVKVLDVEKYSGR